MNITAQIGEGDMGHTRSMAIRFARKSRGSGRTLVFFRGRARGRPAASMSSRTEHDSRSRVYLSNFFDELRRVVPASRN
jgi:hypothetical protein